MQKKTFAERFQFISDNAKRTKRLEDEILNISMNISSVAASKILRRNIANKLKSTICEMIKKAVLIDRDTVKRICIDDFALKRREKYATVMIDIESGKVIDILNSRDYDDVKQWLEEYPNIEVVCRDGSVAYSKAIKDSHCEAIQISDRFHLLKNLTDYCREYIKGEIKNKIKIEMPMVREAETKYSTETKKYHYKTKWELILAVKEMISDGCTINEVCRVLGLGNKTVIKYSKINESDKEKYDREPIGKSKQEDICKRKEELIEQAKLLRRKGYSITGISRELGLDRKTVKKYLESDGRFNHASKGRKFKSKLDNYKECILELFSKGYSGARIFEEIKQMGYDGSYSLVRNFIANINKERIFLEDRNEAIKTVERKSLISLLYRGIEEQKAITAEELEKVMEIYPQLKVVYRLVKQFKEILLNKEVFKVEQWLKESEELDIPELNSFVSGVKRDYEAVRNCIMYEYSNGLAEGVINKIKIIKRIMYGRCSFEMLRSKVLLFNFN